MSVFRKLKVLRIVMLVLNMLIVLGYGCTAVQAVAFCRRYDLSRELLAALEHTPRPPWQIFITCMILYLLLAFLLLFGFGPNRSIKKKQAEPAVLAKTSVPKSSGSGSGSGPLAGFDHDLRDTANLQKSEAPETQTIPDWKSWLNRKVQAAASWSLDVESMENGRIWLQMIVVMIMLWLIDELDFIYNGLVLMTFCFFLPSEKQIKTPWKTIGLCTALFMVTEYHVISVLLVVGHFQAYIDVFSRSVQQALNLGFSLAGSMNLVCFIVYVSVFLLDQYQRAQNVEKELEMVSAVNTELQNYAAITEKIGENKERKRLAREIHDTLGHALTGIAAGIDACLVLIDINPPAARKQLEVVSKVVRQGIGDVRNSLNKLRPGALEQSSFQAALEKMIREFMEVSSLLINFDYRLGEFDFDVTKEDMLFRIVQESITNALRHGHASEVWISMYSDEDRIILSIRDNGQGCGEIKPGYGLTQMKERVGMMGGKIYHDGSQGFMTIVNLPVEKGESQERKQT